MIEEKINKTHPAVRILVVPLDWGLGHATRCIPIINYLQSQGVEVILAGECETVKIFGNTQPKPVILPLKGYRVRYSRNKGLFFLKMLIQFPKIIAAIFHEKNWLKKTVVTHQINAVISDNRFGLSHPGIPSVFISHQLAIKTGNSLLDAIAQKINYHFISKFNECWVPDLETGNNLAGNLSHPKNLPNIPVSYLGILSRFKKYPAEKKYDLLIILSGPEPQRSIFENLLIEQLRNIKGRIALVRGLPVNDIPLSPGFEHAEIYNHLPAENLNEIILQSENIIARCGYSTVMDLVTLQQKAILVPTPGQTEQEYLATYLMEKKIFYTCQQENFSIVKAIESSSHFNLKQHEIETGMQEDVINKWVQKLKQ
jgi:UDP-N-acetylglucosamine transferase subunit ALG13